MIEIYYLLIQQHLKNFAEKSPRDVMVKVLDCDQKVSGFELQSRYYVHFRTNILGKGINP